MDTNNPHVSFGNLSVSRNLLIDITRLKPPYADGTFAPPDAGHPLSQPWQQHLESSPSRTGYEAALYSTELEGEKRYFVYHQATNDILDMPSVTALANNKTIPQVVEAQAFTRQAMEYIAQTDPQHQSPLIQTGYSLGAAVAILASTDDQPVIAFDPPSTKKALATQGRDNAQTANRVLEILSPHPNMFNAHGEHVGHTLIAGEKYWKNAQPSFEDFFTMTLHSHHSKNLAKGLESMDSLPTMPAAERGYTHTAWDAFREYMHEQVNETSPLKSRATKLVADALGALRLDRVGTRIITGVADTITGNIHRNYASKPLLSPPARIVEAAVEPTPALTAPPLPQAQTGFASRITAERAQAATQQRGIG